MCPRTGRTCGCAGNNPSCLPACVRESSWAANILNAKNLLFGGNRVDSRVTQDRCAGELVFRQRARIELCFGSTLANPNVMRCSARFDALTAPPQPG